MTRETVSERIAREESARFLDENFSQLDTSSCVSMLRAASDEFAASDEKGLNNVDISGLPKTNLLKKFIDDPDDETIRQIAEEASDPELIAQVRNAQAGKVAQQFTARHPEYLSCDQNLSRIVNFIAHEHLGRFFDEGEIDDGILELAEIGAWTLDNVERTYAELLHDGLLQVPSNIIRRLNKYEQLEVVRLAQAGQTELAIQKYLEAALGQENPSIAVASDPDLIQTCNESVMFVFEHSATDYVPSAARRMFIDRYSAGRPLTLALVHAAWAECKRREALGERGQMLGLAESPSDRDSVVGSIEELDDASVESLYKNVRKHIAKTSRGPGLLD